MFGHSRGENRSYHSSLLPKMCIHGDAKSSDLVMVLDFGSQYTHLITRRIRSLSVFSVCIPGNSSLSRISSFSPSVIILSGGPHSVLSTDSPPSFPDGFLEHVKSNGIYLLGICYGLQLLVHTLGGVVKSADKCEYGNMDIITETANPNGLFSDANQRQQVWMSHGDEVLILPPGFAVAARSQQGSIAAIEDTDKRFYGLQYHPEVTHTSKGMETLSRFLFDVCKIRADWKMSGILDEEIMKVREMVGPEEHAICALSGGVDSAVAAVLVYNAIGERLHCVFVDNGLLRFKERERVMDTFNTQLHLPVTCIDAADQFLSRLKGIVDAETKRKIIGEEFIRVFDRFSHSLKDKLGKEPTFLVQGTLYPDVIESCPPPGTEGYHSHTIKSHHNVGGLPRDMKLKLIEPLKLLFKDEVRALGRILNVPESFLKRHPFPGPGLAVRVLGDVTEGNAVDVLREVDEIFIDSINEVGLYDSIWQAFAVFLPVKTVGVQGDKRTHSHVVALRAVTSEDGMTANWYPFELSFLDHVARKICNNVPDVNRVVLDITSKPPSTIEWE